MSEKIDWIEAQGVYVNLHVGDRTYLYRSTVAQLEQRLDPEKFVRVHRSAMVNTSRIRELRSLTHGEYAVALAGGTELKLSRSYRGAFEAWLKQPL